MSCLAMHECNTSRYSITQEQITDLINVPIVLWVRTCAPRASGNSSKRLWSILHAPVTTWGSQCLTASWSISGRHSYCSVQVYSPCVKDSTPPVRSVLLFERFRCNTNTCTQTQTHVHKANTNTNTRTQDKHNTHTSTTTNTQTFWCC